MHTQLNPNARLLCARHRQMRRAIRVFVDHHSSGFQRLRDLLGKRGVARPDRGAQAIGAVVGKIDSLLHCRKREDGQDGAKLFLRDQPASMRTGLSRPAHHGGTCSWQPMEVPSVRDIHRDPRLGDCWRSESVLEQASIRAGRWCPTPHAACAPGALAIPDFRRAPSKRTVAVWRPTAGTGASTFDHGVGGVMAVRCDLCLLKRELWSVSGAHPPGSRRPAGSATGR